MSARAALDASRGGRVITRRPLLYARGSDAALDRPAHVRAGSALVALAGGRLAVVQDDASFLALIDPVSGDVGDIPFPMNDGTRQFDDGRGNKKQKLDLEAAFVARSEGAELVVALGSGSSPLRERVVLVEGPTTDAPRVSIVSASAFYGLLRADERFAGAELNLEGAAAIGDDVVLFQRGNGAPTTSHEAVDATARVALTALLASLRGDAPPPALRDVIAWDLGTHDGKRLTFTDGAVTSRGEIAFLACAEDSPDATRDGPVSAVAIGRLDERARTYELASLVDELGAPLLDKAEGLAFVPDDPSRAYVVTDRDDPNAPCELLEIRLGEAWYR